MAMTSFHTHTQVPMPGSKQEVSVCTRTYAAAYVSSWSIVHSSC